MHKPCINIKKGAFAGAVFLLLSALLFVACSKEDLPRKPKAIGWDISSEDRLMDAPDSKALINSYINLRDACTQNEDGAEKIGIFGSYTLDGTTETVFNNIDLWWWEKEDGNPYDDQLGDPSRWNYEGEGKHWVDNASYVFRGYFPKSKITLQPGSNSNKLLIVYDTQASQFDMMVAARELESGEENPVKLIFKHTLSAIKFDFQFTESGITDKLTACWLENTASDGFYTGSTLNYGNAIFWPGSTPNPVGSRIYYWEPANPMTIESNEATTAYSTFALSNKGGIYTDNDGWVLVIPQTMKGPNSLKLCFKTDTGGDEVFQVGLPATVLEAGSRYTFHIKMSATNIDLKLTITDWNERKSSHHIDFNE